MGGVPVGWARERVENAGGELRTGTNARIVLNRLSARVEMGFVAEVTEDAAGRLRGVRLDTRLSNQATTLRADVVGDSVRIETAAGGRTYARMVPTGGALLGPEAVRRRTLATLRRPGDRLVYRTFPAELGQVSEVTRTLVARERLRVGRREVAVTRVEEKAAAASYTSVAWLDPDGRLVTSSVPGPFGETRQRLADSSSAALAASGGTLPAETYVKTLVPTQVRLPRARQTTSLTLELRETDPSRGWPALDGPGQQVLTRSAERLVLRVTPVVPSVGTTLPLRPSPATRPYLAANAYVQADQPEIAAQASRIVGEERDELRAALRLERWVSENMHFDPGVVLAPSTEVLERRRGTCLGYAVLLTTLARAAGIPARVAVGYAYLGGILGGHAWTEILVGDAWVPIDAALPGDVGAGVADGARFAFLHTSLDEGAVALSTGGGMQLFGNLEARVLEHGVAGERATRVPAGPAYALHGGAFVDRGLGLRLTAPAGFRFRGLGQAWPSDTIVILAGASDTVSVTLDARQPWETERTAAMRVTAAAMDAPGSGGSVSESGSAPAARIEPMPRTVAGRSAVLVAGPARAVAALVDGSDVYVVVARGADARAQLERTLAGLELERPPASGRVTARGPR